jgi:glycosyltransferase involved in cell wall biosynthesis
LQQISDNKISVIIPAKNEADSLSRLLPEIRKILPESEIILVNDGSTDNTSSIAQDFVNHIIHHPHSLGNGAAIKAGARIASREYLLFMDADGQHKPDDIPLLVETISRGYTMVVGARHPSTHANILRKLANSIYNNIASYLTGQKIKDLTSGFRIVRANEFRKFIYLLPNGFSYPTTITMALSRNGQSLTYVEIHAKKREGGSHINPIRDGIRFLLIIFKISALYSPLKIFAPTSFLCFAVGFSYYLYTYLTDGRFTNMGILLFITALIIFMIGLLSEQITTLLYTNSDSDAH